MVLSAPPVINRVPVTSNVEQNTPASASSEPGCGISSMFWNAVPVFQSQSVSEPLSPPEKKTPSEFTESVLMIALCPLKLKTNMPSGHFHFLMLLPPADADAKVYSVGWMASARTDFLWWVSVTIVFPAARSHSLDTEITERPRET